MNGTVARARELAGAVTDPELPGMRIDDLGVLRDVRAGPAGVVEVDLTPTYSGCPAIEAIRADVLAALARCGLDGRVRTVLSPPWSSADITERGRRALAAAGIAPPTGAGSGPVAVELGVRCPRCGSTASRLVSRFGSTPCLAQHACRDCGEPFDRVKDI